HVVCALLGEPLAFWQYDPGGYADACTKANALWEESANARPVFELVGEVESAASNSAPITGIVAHHGKVDMAVLALEKMPLQARQLALSSAAPKLKDTKVFVVGYPVADARGSSGPITPVPIFQGLSGLDTATPGAKGLAP